MHKFIHIAVLLIVGSFFVSSAQAGQHPECDPLQEPGVTPGLYGLCNAYISSGGNQSILANYNKKKLPGDPDLLDLINGGSYECPCWGMDELAETAAFSPDSCSLNAFFGAAIFENEASNPLQFMAQTDGLGASSCFVWDTRISATGFIPTTPEENAVCFSDINEFGNIFDFGPMNFGCGD
jgi:hypothetical protein